MQTQTGPQTPDQKALAPLACKQGFGISIADAVSCRVEVPNKGGHRGMCKYFPVMLQCRSDSQEYYSRTSHNIFLDFEVALVSLFLSRGNDSSWRVHV